MYIKFLLDFEKYLRADVVEASPGVLTDEVDEFASLSATPNRGRQGYEVMGFYHRVHGIIVHRITTLDGHEHQFGIQRISQQENHAMTTPNHLEHMLANGLRNLKRGLDAFSKDDFDFALTDFYCGLEIILKAIVLQEDWRLVFDEPGNADQAKLNKGTAKTIVADKAFKRLAVFAQKPISTETEKAVSRIRVHRNKLMHFYHPDLQSVSRKKQLQQTLPADGMHFANYVPMTDFERFSPNTLGATMKWMQHCLFLKVISNKQHKTFNLPTQVNLFSTARPARCKRLIVGGVCYVDMNTFLITTSPTARNTSPNSIALLVARKA